MCMGHEDKSWEACKQFEATQGVFACYLSLSRLNFYFFLNVTEI